MEILLYDILAKFQKDTKNDGYKPTPEQASFENFVLNKLKNNVTKTGNLTPAALFHLVDQLEVLAWRQMHIQESALLNSFQQRVDRLISLVGFDVLLVAHRLKFHKIFNINNLNQDIDKVILVRVVYDETKELFKEIIVGINKAIQTKFREITSEIETIGSRLDSIQALIEQLSLFTGNDYSSEFKATTTQCKKQAIIEKSRMRELQNNLTTISNKIELYNEQEVTINSKPCTSYKCKESYLEISETIDTVLKIFEELNQPELMGNSIKVLDIGRTKFLETFQTIFELLEEPRNYNGLEIEKSEPVVESIQPVFMSPSTTSALVCSASFFDDVNAVNDASIAPLPHNGDFKEMELKSFLPSNKSTGG